MGFFIKEPVGLIIAFLNVLTFVLLIYTILKLAAEGRSKLLQVLDGIFAPLLNPMRRILPPWKLDLVPVILAVLLQLIAFALKKGYR